MTVVPDQVNGSSSKGRRFGTVALSLVIACTSLFALTPPASAAEGDTITGSVWQDYDSDGVFDTFESGMAGLEVYAYDSDGTEVGPVTSGADGAYSLAVTGDAEQWRVEANIPDTPEWARWRETAHGADNRSTVQFVTSVPATDVNFSFQVPSAYVENDPNVYIPVIQYAGADGPSSGSPGGVVQTYGAISPADGVLASTTMNVPFSQIGATNGSAWQRPATLDGNGQLFTAAYFRRHSGFGPNGIGAIYEVTPDGGDFSGPTGSASLFVDVTDFGIDVGDESDAGAGPGANGLRPRAWTDNPPYDWTRDAQAWSRVGRAGLGGIAFSSDETAMFAVNLHNRSLIRIDTGFPAADAPASVTEIELDEYFPDNSDLRPYGVSANPLTNEMYLTVTDTAESTGDPNDLHGYVYRFSPDSPADLELVLDFPLGFPRGVGHIGPGTDWDVSYNPWSLDPADFPRRDGGITVGTPVPVVSDVKYLHGNLVIGIRDLSGDLFGTNTFHSPEPGDDAIATIRVTGGDIYIAEPNEEGTWTLEQNGVVNGVKGEGQISPVLSPTGDKFINDSWSTPSDGPQYDAQALGSLVVLPSRDDGIMSTALHAANGGGQVGTRRFYQETGANFLPRGATIRSASPVDATFKGNGLGSMSILASAAPIEIGNYVWYDVDKDGIQDPDEPPVEGATVNLYATDGNGNRTGDPIATTTTDAIGQYYFTSAEDGVLPNTQYVVGVDNPDDYADGGVLEDWQPTQPDTGDPESVDPDLNDSDGIVDDGNGRPYALVNTNTDNGTTGDLGENDHSFDFGFWRWLPQLDKSLESAVENPDDDGTWRLTYNLTVTNQGVSPGEYDLDDDLTQMGAGIELVQPVSVSGPEGVDLPDGVELNAGFDGVDDPRIISDVPIAGRGVTFNEDTQEWVEGAPVEHVYTVVVDVRLTTDGQGEVSASAEDLTCEPAGGGFDPGAGGYNVATLHPDGLDDISDEECASLPKVVVEKELVGEPVPVEGEPGLWSVGYEITVTNQTGVDTDYDLKDTLRFGAGMTIEGSPSIVNTAPGGVVPRPEWDGTSDPLVISDTPIAGGEVQTWSVAVRYRLDLASVPAEPVSSNCSIAEGESGSGLTNDTDISFNGYVDAADVCGPTGEPAMDKTVVSAERLDSGEWQVVYGIDVTNLGAGATEYDLDDELRFDPNIEISSAEVTESPDGVSLTDPAWDGVANQRIADDVALAGKGADDYAPHHYEVTVVAEVPADYLASGGTLTCADMSSPTGGQEAFNNYAELGLVDERTKSDRECPPVGVGDPALDKKVLLPGETLDEAGRVTDTLYKDGKPAPRVVRPGDVIQYGIVVQGNPEFAAADVSVDDVLPAGVKYAGSYVASQGEYDGKVWTIGNLDVGQVVTLIIDVTVQPAEDGTIVTNVAQLNANGKKIEDDPKNPGKDGGRNTEPDDGYDEVDITVDSGDPTLDKKVLLPGETLDEAGRVTDTLYQDGNPAPRQVEPGDTIQYGIVVQGNQHFGSTDVSVDDVLPVGVEYAGNYTASQGVYDGKVWAIGNLDPDQVVTLIIDVIVQPVEDGKIITNTAQLNADGKKIADDPKNPGKHGGRNTGPDDGYDEVDITVRTGDPTLDKKVLLPGETLDEAGRVTDTLYQDGNPAPREVEPGDVIQYGIVVKGNAKFRATDVSVDDVLPAGVKYAGTYQASQGDYDGKVWMIGTLEAGQVVTLIIDVTVQPVEDGKIITNTAQLRANGKKIADDGERDGRNTKPTDGWDAVDIVVSNPGATSPDDDGTDDGDNDGDNGGLPDTGSSAGMLAALGAGVLLLLGGGLALAARRRSLGGHGQ